MQIVSLQEKRSRQGVCIYCGKEAPKQGRKGCAQCLGDIRAATQEKRETRSAAGLCAYCGQAPPVANRKGCAGCLSVAAHKTANWTEAQAEARQVERQQRRLQKLTKLRKKTLTRLSEIEAEINSLSSLSEAVQREAA
jgi:hypothetical protein